MIERSDFGGSSLELGAVELKKHCENTVLRDYLLGNSCGNCETQYYLAGLKHTCCMSTFDGFEKNTFEDSVTLYN